MRASSALLGLTLSMTLLLPAAAFPQGCSIPPSYTNRATVAEGNLLVTLATDNDVYLVGSPVQIWLSFENTGSVPLTIPNPSMISPMQGILILPASCDSLDESGCDNKWVYRYPFGVFFFGSPLTLNPGQCASTERVWDGIPPATIPLVPGLHTVFGGMNTSMGEFHAPSGGVKLPIQIQSSSAVPVWPASWGTMKSKYE